MRKIITLAIAIGCLNTSLAFAGPKVEFKTNVGSFVVELDADKAPKTSANFLNYVKSGFYNGTIFHRVIDGFMIQGGGFTAELSQKPTDAPVPSEAQNGLKNLTYTIAMARTSDPDSATAQFFINVENNSFLDHRDNGQGFGYAVFGKVKSGMSVVSKIKMAKTGNVKGYSDVPLEPIIIKSMKRK